MKLESNIDRSVNFIEEKLEGFIESRFVRKTDPYFICYLSSQLGCSKGCKFCHLTATNQKAVKDCTTEEFLVQSHKVFSHYLNSIENQGKAQYVHYNFMARGEALSNKIFHNHSSANELLHTLGLAAIGYNLNPKFNLSTILPKDFTKSLTDVFKLITPTIYYSLYSVNEDFRKHWIPSAMKVEDSLRLLKDYQDMSKKIVKIHFSFIEGQNDSIERDLAPMVEMIKKSNLICDFNLVRYNPFSEIQGKETSEEVILKNLEFLKENLKGKVQMIPRVGFDVKASCGMFVNKK